MTPKQTTAVAEAKAFLDNPPASDPALRAQRSQRAKEGWETRRAEHLRIKARIAETTRGTLQAGEVVLSRQAAACALEALKHPNGYAASWDGATTATRMGSEAEGVVHISVALRGGGCDAHYVRCPSTFVFEEVEKPE